MVHSWSILGPFLDPRLDTAWLSWSVMDPSVLYLNSSHTIAVLDIPTSLEVASGGIGRTFSSTPPVEPYVTPEPKGKKREVFLARIPPREIQYHQRVQLAITRALQSVHECQLRTRWYLPRLLDDDTEEGENMATGVCHDGEMSFLPVVLSLLPNYFNSVFRVQNVLVCHQSSTLTSLCTNDGTSFVIPGESTFIWSSIENALDVLSDFFKNNETSLELDLVVMDPPWANRSVRNARKYSTMDEQEADPFDQALQLVDSYLAERGHVAIWITNKLAIRHRVCASMQEREFVLIEEWFWTKITTKGEPVTPLDGLWRRPYEVMLLFKREALDCVPLNRFLFAVPDLHSRKPNLKSMFDVLLSPQKVLELFARNLTSSWWSIGNEVLKFQNSRLWSTTEQT